MERERERERESMCFAKKLKITQYTDSTAHLLSKLHALAAEERIQRASPFLGEDYSRRLYLAVRNVVKQKYMLLILHCYFVPTAHVYVIYQRITLLGWKRGFALRAS
jgi:hypothetical protein